MSTSANSYLENYQKLKQIADAIRHQTEPDIDKLVLVVDQATVAYTNSQARLEAVESALKSVSEK